MKSLNRISVVCLSGFLLSGCSSSQSDVAEQELRGEIESQSEGHIKLLSFGKTDGQKFELNGMQGYRLDFEAEITFEQDGTWLSGGDWPNRLSFRFSKDRPSSGSIAGFMDTIDGGRAAHSGERIRIGGVMLGTKKESGWKFEPSESHVAGVSRSSGAAHSTVADDAAKRQACIALLWQIKATKKQWALENNKESSDVPFPSDLLPYLSRGGLDLKVFPSCPAGGVYNLKSVFEKPTCSIPGHSLD